VNRNYILPTRLYFVAQIKRLAQIDDNIVNKIVNNNNN